MSAVPIENSSSPVGLIGLGLMGGAMASRLQRAAFRLLGWDRDAKRVEEFVQAGHGRAGTSEDDIFAQCTRVILSLPDSNVVNAVLQNGNRLLTVGQVIVDTSTGDPASAEALGAVLAKQGAHYLDATVSGSSVQVADGSAVLMVGGDRVAFAACSDLFAQLGAKTFHTGPCGSGAKVKLVTNLVLGLNRAALAEGLVFARQLDLDSVLTLEIMRGSMAYSRIMDTKGEKMLREDFTPQARLSQHLKDVRLMLAASAKKLPLSEAHRTLLERAESLGCGDLDNSAIIKAYE
ncbi:MAG: NAD(P)-dependent oxidoreductase [Verrucomicrobiaceae bacterium]|nr:NAD(P)-dependent oxidoreductase [Verrucomicrobiaceae bacterium]